jgi:hypothetical protein
MVGNAVRRRPVLIFTVVVVVVVVVVVGIGGARARRFIDATFPLCKLHTEPLTATERDEEAIGPVAVPTVEPTDAKSK